MSLLLDEQAYETSDDVQVGAAESPQLAGDKGGLTELGRRVMDELVGTLSIELGDYQAAVDEARLQIESGEADVLALQLDEPPPAFGPDDVGFGWTVRRARATLVPTLIACHARARGHRPRRRSARTRVRTRTRSPGSRSDDPDPVDALGGGQR